MRVGVIGAGATGLAAAYELVKHGHQVAVYERAPFLGGQASTFDVGGARLERGYHHLFTSDVDILGLAEQIGLGHRMHRIESKVGTLYDGKIYDFVTPLDLLKFTPLSLINRIRLGLVTLLIQRIGNWRRLERFTAVEWLRKNAGESVYEVFWGPMLRGKFGEDYYDQVGMAWVWGKIHTRFASRGRGMAKEVLVYPIGSFGELFDVLAQRIREQGGEVHTSVAVTRIEVEAAASLAYGSSRSRRPGPPHVPRMRATASLSQSKDPKRAITSPSTPSSPPRPPTFSPSWPRPCLRSMRPG